MSDIWQWLVLSLLVLMMPPLAIGLIRKTKARLQNRIGARVTQPLLDLLKMIGKFETVSESASRVLRGAAAGNAAITLFLALCAPWIPFGPRCMHSDLFLVIYLFVLLRFMTIVAALDTSSPFGGFGAAREIMLPVLVEPGIVLCFVSLGVLAGTSDLTQIFSFANIAMSDQHGVWILAGCGLYMASLIELSRMPVDDPTTHLELTMIHEAMVLENSGPNLALTEYAHALKLLLLIGLAAQCLIHGFAAVWFAGALVQLLLWLATVLMLLLLTACIESGAVKLRWTKLPAFIAYAVTFGALCAVFVLGG